VDVYLEVGTRRVFAAALDWPGWARSGRTPEAALQALVDYGSRFVASMGSAVSALRPPADVADLRVVETLEGTATTDFGAPGVIPSADRRPLTGEELRSLIKLLEVAWSAFEKSADAAEGKTLAPAGPRGGGRTVAKMRAHVIDADAAYTTGLGGRSEPNATWAKVHGDFVAAATARARGELPDRGPRGGERWPARYAIRRSAWHALDHAWEIEDRIAR
jgi:hypothetical protein